MTEAQQIAYTARARSRAVNMWRVQLSAFNKETVALFRPGQRQLSLEQRRDFERLQLKTNIAVASVFVGEDIRQFKQIDPLQLINENTPPDALKNALIAEIAVETEKIIANRSQIVVPEMIKSIEDFLRRTNTVVSPDAAIQEYRNVLRNYLDSHSIIVAQSEVTATGEATRRVVVKVVNEPMQNTLRSMLDLIEGGDINGARKLQRQLNKLTKLPLSLTQGVAINTIAQDPRLFSPLVQAGTVARLREDVDKLAPGRQEKKWRTSGGSNIRPSHQAANGQVKHIDQPFELEGGLLQYPGDGSLGAPLSEIIGCQCVHIFV